MGQKPIREGESTMNGTVSNTGQVSRGVRTLRQLRRSIGVVTGLLVGAVGLIAAAPAAFAMHLEQPTGPAGAPTPTTTVVHSGMLGWEITLIAVGAAVVSAFATAFLLRMGSGRRLGHAAS
jgi:hypothetical protein